MARPLSTQLRLGRRRCRSFLQGLACIITAVPFGNVSQGDLQHRRPARALRFVIQLDVPLRGQLSSAQNEEQRLQSVPGMRACVFVGVQFRIEPMRSVYIESILPPELL